MTRIGRCSMAGEAAVFLCICLVLAPLHTSGKARDCSPFADIVFIVDGSESIRISDFPKVKDYLKREVKALNVFPEGANVGLILYSDSVNQIIPLTASNTADLERQIEALKQPRQGTNTALALQETRTLYRRQGRSGATKIAILITDGDFRDTYPPRRQAKNLKDDGVTLITIGVGKDVVESELNILASDRNYVKMVETFGGLEMLRLPYQEVCTNESTSPPEECEIDGNVIFIVDGSESIKRDEEATMKRFLKAQVDLLRLGDGKAGMGLVLFSNDATEEIRLSNTLSSSRLKQLIGDLRFPSRGSNIGEGIEVMTSMFRRYGRRAENRIAILITDGVSMDREKTAEIASLAKREGIELVAIGIGSPMDIDFGELTNIASRPGLVFTPDTFTKLESTEYASKLSAGRECGNTQTTTVWTTRSTTRTPWTTRRTTTRRTTTRRTTPRTTRRTTPRTTRRTTPRTTRRTTRRITTRTTRRTTRRTPPRTTPRTPRTTRATNIRLTTRRRPVIIDPTGMCDECRIRFGSGFARHPDSCAKFIRCYLQRQRDGSYRVSSSIVFDCPLGLFWDQENTLTCRYPSQVNCPLDRCQSTNGLLRYGDPTDCQVFWVCGRGGAVARQCCETYFAFDDRRGECVRDDRCDSRLCRVGDPQGNCPFLANNSNETWFMVVTNGVQIGRQCPAGLAFVQKTCGCHRSIPLPGRLPVQGCKPDVYLPFDDDIRDHSGWNRGVGNWGTMVEKLSDATGGGAGKFDGTDSVWIYRYNNMEFPPYVEIRFRFKESPLTTGRSDPEALVTNGNCGTDPSIAISSDRRSTDVGFFTATTKNSVQTEIAYRPNGWTDVTYIYDRSQLTVTLGSGSQNENLSGVILRTHNPLILGTGEGFQNFTGYIDEFYVYFCKP